MKEERDERVWESAIAAVERNSFTKEEKFDEGHWEMVQVIYDVLNKPKKEK